jgi:hypothetical protein
MYALFEFLLFAALAGAFLFGDGMRAPRARGRGGRRG